MNQSSPIENLIARLDEYKRKYYLNLLLKGIIFSAAVLLSAYLFFNTIEYFARFGTSIRAILFFTFLATLGFVLVFWIIKPLIFLYGYQKPLSNEEAAKQIGKFFPEVGDKLLNTLQLATISSSQNELLLASIQQKSRQLGIVRFADAINLQDNRKYLKYALVPFFVIVAILFISPKFFADSSTRIVNFKNEYAEEAPFSFILQNQSMQAFKNEDYMVNLQLMGNVIPENVYLVFNERKFKMETTDQRHYNYTFRKVQKDFEFNFEAAGFKSNEFEIAVVNRPALVNFDVTLKYPSYLNKPNEAVQNVGNLAVPEGTVVEWNFDVIDADSVLLAFDGTTKKQSANKSLISGNFNFEHRAKNSSGYQIFLRNQYATNQEGISYFLNVIPDKFPQILLEQYKDSTLYNYIVLGGNISDDYGISLLKVFYNVKREKDQKSNAFASINLPVNRSQNIQSFYYQWQTDSLKLNPGDKLEYYVQVWDNDGVNGAKSTRTPMLTYAVPSKQQIDKEIESQVDKTEAQLDKTLKQAEKLRRDINSLENRLKNKKDLDYQDKKLAEELIRKREELMNEIRELQQQNQNSMEKQQRFQQQSPELAQKFEQLQKLMNELNDPETNKMYEELKQMLEKNQDERMLDMLDKLKNKERNLEKELDRALSLFKKLQMNAKIDKNVEELKKLAEEQEKLAEKTEDEGKKNDASKPNEKGKEDKKDNKKEVGKENKDGKENKEAKDNKENSKENQDGKNPEKKDGEKKSEENKNPNDQLMKEQEKLEKNFEEIQKNLDQLEKDSKEMEDNQPLDTDKQQQKDIQNEQQNSKQNMEKQQNSQSAKSQRNAARSMRNLAGKLASMKMSMEMKETEENMDDLRDILENLVTLSFDQERIMKEFRGVNLADPRFVKLAQEQAKLQDDAKVIEDSLYALSKRVMQIESFVTRELTNMKMDMNSAVSFIKQRRLPQATAKQQSSMTDINNLALMLSDVLKQMQQQMMAMMMPGQGKGKNKGKNNMPSMGKMQEEMNQSTQKLQQSGKGGRAMSEELARLAAQQAQIRKMLQQAADGMKGTEKGKQLGDQIQEMMKQMEQNEEDLVNKRLNQNLVQRQKDLLTRLLESEKAMQEQEEDNKRKAETARQVERKVPPKFEQYVKDKQKQTELLRTVPPSLSPFYKREVDNYFKKIN
ncbi:MAG: DUF4175 family protein [Spirosomataceae bacterium]